MRKLVKRGAAVVLTALLAAPVQTPIGAYGASVQSSDEAHTMSAEPEIAAEAEGKERSEKGESESVASPGNAVSVTAKESAKAAGSAEKSWGDEVRFNTGSYEVRVVDRESFDEGDGDAFFAEDGSYTINIPESNPFFPYEVQFTGEGGTGSEWFMTPDDSVEIDGHEFFVSAYFDGTAVTQISLDVAGDTVVVYPEEKEFTDGDGTETMSLLPLERRSLSVDLRAYTPVELTMVKIKSIFTGEEELKSTDQVVWAQGDDIYTISSPEDTIDFNTYDYYYDDRHDYYSTGWRMIVGVGDQLAAENIRYYVTVDTTNPKHWLTPVVYRQDSEGKREKLTVVEGDRYVVGFDGEELRIAIPDQSVEDIEEAYIGLEVNEDIFENPLYDHLKIYQGAYTDPQKAETEGTDITDQLFAEDMTQKDRGIQYLEEYRREKTGLWVTMVSYDSEGKAVGCLPIRLVLSRRAGSVALYSLLWEKTENGFNEIYCDYSSRTVNGCNNITIELREGHRADKKYFLRLNYYNQQDIKSPSSVVGAYVGQFSSVEEASEAKATDIKDSLFGIGENDKGYEANYSKGMYFTIFAKVDGLEEPKIHKVYITVEESEISGPVLNDSTGVSFTGLRDKNGDDISCYILDSTEDSYGDYAYRTILVKRGIDLTELAPEFWVDVDGINLYASEGNSESVLQVSGESIHDFSKGPVHYTASAESKENSRNYWLQVVRQTEGAGTLYINSFADPDAGTRVENGTVYSTREMILDGRYEYMHDIVLINTGMEDIPQLSAEIDSAEVQLDEYWTLKGEYPLSGFDSINQPSNMAKIRVVPKENMDDGRDISGTLKIKSGDKVLVELKLTGTVGDPSITTTEIPDSVKYVPYGTMIQNSNKYEWNEVTYQLTDGKLPEGMVIKPNGELYGVPTETGEFTFTVRMDNSYEYFGNSVRIFIIRVVENTDSNVEGATDQGYELTSRVQSITLNSSADQTMVSEGVYDEFVDLYLDGEKLKKDEDYISESGSTRITIKSQTLKRSNTTGTHTLGIEFRTKDTDTLKRAAQNYEIRTQSSSGGNGGSSGSGSGSSGGSSSGGSGGTGGSRNSGSASNTSSVATDSQKGHVNSATGIITGEGAGYSRWVQDDNGWKLIYADGTMAAGATSQLENGDVVEQILWEQVNGSWYAFGVNGYLKSGWVYDYQLGSWYLTSADNGMQSGWYTDPQDGCTYYMEPGTGKLAIGWKMIDGKWYYFHAVSQAPTWELNRETGNWFYNTRSVGKPFGSLYRSERTPDGYVVDGDGRWNGESNQ